MSFMRQHVDGESLIEHLSEEIAKIEAHKKEERT